MKTLTHSITRTLAAALLAVVAAAPLFAADAVKFRPATAADPVVGRYLVTIATADAATDATTADVLARSYGGRIEPYAVEGFRGFMIVMAPSRARALSADPRVAIVEEQAGREEDSVFAVPEQPRSAVTAPPAPRTEAVRQPRTDWVQGNALWESGPIDYDGAGNVKSIGTDLYRYDGTGRLTYATAKTAPSPANAQQFEYDRYGNLKRVTTTTTSGTEVTRYALDAAANNRLTTTCPAGETYNDCVTGIYDDAGNQTGITTAGEFVWDPLGMMKERHGVGVQRYLYDAAEERIATIHYVAGIEARRTYTLRGADNKVAREVSYDSATAQWKLIRDYVYRDGALIAAFGSTGNTPAVHYHVDHLGSTRLVTDGAGYQSAFHTYWPFGEEAPGSDLDAERLKFTGHERDSFGDGSLDLDYMHARFYDPNKARFMSIDPARSESAGQPQSWNRYSYAANNPLRHVDPDGRYVAVAPSMRTTISKTYANSATFRRVYDAVHRDRSILQKLSVGNTRLGSTRAETKETSRGSMIVNGKIAVDAAGKVIPAITLNTVIGAGNIGAKSGHELQHGVEYRVYGTPTAAPDARSSAGGAGIETQAATDLERQIENELRASGMKNELTKEQEANLFDVPGDCTTKPSKCPKLEPTFDAGSSVDKRPPL